MTPLQIKQVAAEIAACIPAMAQDCATNNAVVIEGMMTAFKPSEELSYWSDDLEEENQTDNPPAKCPRCGKLVRELQVPWTPLPMR